MCTNQREIINKYTGHSLYVKCGKCPSCLQEKASYRVSRIKAQDSKDLTTLLVTLTYRRSDVPYVLRDDAFKFSRGEIKTLSVYRDVSYRKVRKSGDYLIGYNINHETKKLCDIEFINSCDFHRLKDLKFYPGKIGICYYPDVQNFMAKLRLNLKRNFNYDGKISSFCCSEYGSKSLRPHFHLLLWCRKGDKETLRNAVIESWSFSDMQNFPRSFEEAFRASSYVASYVNCNDNFPAFLKTYFKPKHSYSKGFGLNYDFFKLPVLLQKVRQGSLSYTRQVDKQGFPTIVTCPFPKYVVSRYFPKFKGYSRVAPFQRNELMQRLYECYTKFVNDCYDHKGFVTTNERRLFASRLGINRIAYPVYYSDLDIYRIGVRLKNSFVRFNEYSGMSNAVTFSEYCNLYQSVWTCYNSTVLKLHLENPDIPLYEKYDNLEKYKLGYDYFGSSLPVGFTRDMIEVTDPNLFRSTLNRTSLMSQSFHDHLKHRNVSNLILSSVNEEF